MIVYVIERKDHINMCLTLHGYPDDIYIYIYINIQGDSEGKVTNLVGDSLCY